MSPGNHPKHVAAQANKCILINQHNSIPAPTTTRTPPHEPSNEQSTQTDRHPRALDPTHPKAAAQREKPPAPPQRTTVRNPEISLRQFNSYTRLANLHARILSSLTYTARHRLSGQTVKVRACASPCIRKPTHRALTRASHRLLPTSPLNFRPHPLPIRANISLNQPVSPAPIQHIVPISQYQN
jgi:hypothetical protein